MQVIEGKEIYRSLHAPALPILGRRKPSSDNISLGDVISAAPLLMSICVPYDCSAWMWPGTANTSRLKFSAYLAVINEPDFCPASMMRVACDSPAINRFLAGKAQLPIGYPGSHGDNRAPPLATIRFARSRWIWGYISSQSRLEPGKATQCRPASNAAMWAMLSIPTARPETIVIGYPFRP